MTSSATIRVRQDGRVIRCIREERGITAAALARSINYSPHTVYQIERDAQSASTVLLHRVANALDVPFESLLRDPEVAR